ncbi:DUF2127 domain-containing protein [Mesorhizobium sp. M0601]|uniref:DUF2127 domain-containing protein n=1 Tax=Mesorhizobium sp. M0601 TaxID=2956969 RepID=UPI0033398825
MNFVKAVDERRIHQIFELSIWLKGAHALIECVGGILLYVVTTDAIASWVNTFTQEELIEDPNDFIAGYLSQMASHFSVASKEFYAFYLLSHGLIKLLLVVGLLRGKLWSYPASLAALGAFMIYQVYRYSYTHSFGLLVLTVFDAVVMVLIWHEWKVVRQHKPA